MESTSGQPLVKPEVVGDLDSLTIFVLCRSSKIVLYISREVFKIFTEQKTVPDVSTKYAHFQDR